MNKQEFQDSIYNELLKIGYKPVLFYNKEPYAGKDMFFCPQAPELFILIVTQGATRIQKSGNGHYTAYTTTQIKSPSDIPLLHNELNSIIYNSNESSLKEKSSGCLGMLFFILIIISILLTN